MSAQKSDPNLVWGVQQPKVEAFRSGPSETLAAVFARKMKPLKHRGESEFEFERQLLDISAEEKALMAGDWAPAGYYHGKQVNGRVLEMYWGEALGSDPCGGIVVEFFVVVS